MIPASKAAQWLAAKEAERIAQETRRQLEDEMAREFGFTMVEEGTQNFEVVDPSGAKGADGKPIIYKVKIVGTLGTGRSTATSCRIWPAKPASSSS